MNRGAPPAEERISFYKPPDFPGIEGLAVENGRKLWRIYHETYTVCIPLTSWADISYRGRTATMSGSQLLLLEPGNVHDTKRMPPPASFRVLMVHPSIVEGAARADGLPGTPHFKSIVFSSASLHKSFLALHRSLESGRSFLETQSRLTDCLGRMLYQCTEKSGGSVSFPVPKALLHRTKDYIHAHCTQRMNLADLALMSGFSPFHFLRAFTREFGIPPHTYQLQVRVAKARELLAKGAQMRSLDLGFSDQSHFIRHFKRAVGVTPGEYVRMVKRPVSGCDGL